MALNLSGFFQNVNSQVTTNTGAPVNGSPIVPENGQNMQVSNLGLNLLKNMLAGDTFSGKIMSVEDMNALLKLGDGTSLLAHLTEGANIKAGDTLTFMVESNKDNNITIKPLMQDAQQAVLINKALDAAGLSPSEANVAIVKELLGLNMPVSTEEISNMVKYSTKFPETSLNTLANLSRLNIPVTLENITQFEAYKTYEHSILNELNNIGDNFKQMFGTLISDTMPESAKADTGQLLNNLVNIFYNNVEFSESMPNTPIHEIISKEGFSKLLNDLSSMALKYPDDTEIPVLIRKLQNGEIGNHEFLDKLTSIIKDKPETIEDFKNFFGLDDFKKLLDEMINQTMKLRPAELSKDDSIGNYYKRIKDNIEKAIEAAKDNNSASELMKDMNQVKSNIDFMNDLNKNMTFFQMPIKFSQSDANGELYVFTNKKSIANNPDNISALLHLDMENLGPMDIYVKLAGKNVSTNFCLETEELLDFVYQHIDKLNQRLKSLGYSCEFEMKVNGDNKFDMMKDFVAPTDNTLSTSQYIFDIKA